ncbi:helix-turn-helix domain-containing protein [Streptococcus sciuri]|uniref:XRE family transcriptional regulator n=1 Tax=Streptococcus sciuri TaxID=2973939 RepID=A0ABT2F8V8_9STRE|nr:Rgg/GadR/MutR family transcriptional regulator [Streptococcus sciuri]MCS4488903.1 XRE family transcriptional regulator [Streptococcus sciuri]
MKNLTGKVFKIIRNSKQVSLRQAAGKCISAGQLSRFERNESHLTVDVFLNSLKRMNVSLEEFQYLYNSYYQINDVRLSEELSEAYVSKNMAKLNKMLACSRKLMDEASDSLELRTHTLNCIVIKTIMAYCNSDTTVTEHEITYLMEYLFSVEEWGRYELWLFTNTAGVLSIETLDTFSSEMLKRTQLYYSNSNNRRKIHQMLLNVINLSISRGRNDIAIKYIAHLDKLNILDTDMYEKLLLKYNKAYYSYSNGNNKALDVMKRCAEFLDFIDCEDLYLRLKDEIITLES